MPGDTSEPRPSLTEKEVFFEALERTTVEGRVAYLEGACRHDPALRRRVDALLANHLSEESFMSGPAAEGAAFVVPPSGGTAPGPAQAGTTNVEIAGQRIGRYKLLEQIGEGGMGTVWMAQQEEPVRRRVALKIIKSGMDTREVVGRFEAERQALALMDHPNIARIHDAGATETGRPYFVMELVRGVKFTDYCDQKNVSTRQRLELFVQVCQAVQHAHQKGIIHRDLKPSNILVTVNDGQAVPKIIDFGIAKATQMELTEKTVFTRFQQFLGTPAYMSPEQAELTSVDIDTRSDIYSLGVLLYELLTGKTPFDARELLKAGLDEMRRTIREKEPERPSTRVSTLRGEDRTTTARRRGLDAPKLIRVLRGDLDWIVMKCLEKDRTRRYETANGLATDLKRHLSHEPVVARPPSAAYRFHRLVRRNKLAFAAAGAIAATLVVATLVSLWQAIRATRAEELAGRRVVEVAAERDAKEKARQAAEAAQQEAESVSAFLTEVFQSPDPERDGRTITVAETIERAARQLDTLASQPARRAKLQFTLGTTYIALGLHREAIPLLETARNYYLVTLGPEQRHTLSAMNNLGNSYQMAGRRKEALKLREELLALRRKVNGPEHPETLSAMHNLANSYSDTGRREEALTLREAVLRISRKVNGPEHSDTLLAMNNLANSYFDAGRREEALKMREEVLPLSRKVDGPEHPGTLRAMHNLAHYYSGAGRREEALKLREKLLPLIRKVLGPEHTETVTTANILARAYKEAGKLDQALALYEETLTQCKAKLGPQRRRTRDTMHDLGLAYQEAGMLNRSLPLFEELFKIQQELDDLKAGFHTMDHITWTYAAAGRTNSLETFYREQLAQNGIGLASFGLGRLLLERAKTDTENPGRAEERTREGERLVGEFLASVRSRYTNDPAKLEPSLHAVAELRHRQGKHAEAEPLYRQLLQSRRSRLEPESSDVINATFELGQLLLEWAHSTAEVEQTDARAREALQLFRDYLPAARKHYAGRPNRLEEWLDDLAKVLYRHDKYAEAEPLYRELLQSRQARLEADHEQVVLANGSLGRLLADWAWAERDANSEVRNSESGIVERAREAERLLRECLAIRLRGPRPDHWRTGDVKSRLGAALVSLAVTDPGLNADARQTKLAEAETMLLQANERLQGSRSVEGIYKRDAVERLVRLYEAWGKPEKLSEWQQKLGEFRPEEPKLPKPAEEDTQ